MATPTDLQAVQSTTLQADLQAVQAQLDTLQEKITAVENSPLFQGLFERFMAGDASVEEHHIWKYHQQLMDEKKQLRDEKNLQLQLQLQQQQAGKRISV
jgi:bacterioferritin (cytochrome b1)